MVANCRQRTFRTLREVGRLTENLRLTPLLQDWALPALKRSTRFGIAQADVHHFEGRAALDWVPGLRLLTPIVRAEPWELIDKGGELDEQVGDGSGALGHDYCGIGGRLPCTSSIISIQSFIVRSSRSALAT